MVREGRKIVVFERQLSRKQGQRFPAMRLPRSVNSNLGWGQALVGGLVVAEPRQKLLLLLANHGWSPAD